MLQIPELDRKGLRKFGVISGAIVAIMFGIMIPWIFDHPLKWPWQTNSFGIPNWPWSIAYFLWIIAVIFPSFLKSIYIVWMFLGNIMNWLNTRIILGILFLIMFVPIGLIMKLFGKDPMSRSLNTKNNSYRIKSTHRTNEFIERPF